MADEGHLFLSKLGQALGKIVETEAMLEPTADDMLEALAKEVVDDPE